MTETKKPRARARPRTGASHDEAVIHFGISSSTFSAWGKKAWVVRFPDRSIDIEATAARVDTLKDPRRGGKHDRGTNAKASTPYSGNPEDIDESAPVPEDVDMTEARLRKEHWQAVKAECEARKLQKELVVLVDAKRIYCAQAAAVVSALQAVPIRADSRLDGVTSSHERRTIIRDEIESALKGMPDEPPDLR